MDNSRNKSLNDLTETSASDLYQKIEEIFDSTKNSHSQSIINEIEKIKSEKDEKKKIRGKLLKEAIQMSSYDKVYAAEHEAEKTINLQDKQKELINREQGWKELLKQDLEQDLIPKLYDELADLEAQYNDDRIDIEGKSDIWNNIKHTKGLIEEIESILDTKTNKKSR